MDIIIHKCLDDKFFSECNECPIHPYCSIMKIDLKKKINTEIKDLDIEIQKEIISEVISELTLSMEKFKGTDIPTFRKYLKKIFNNTLSDYFKSKIKTKLSYESYVHEKYNIYHQSSENSENLGVELSSKEQVDQFEALLDKEKSSFILNNFRELLIKEGYRDCADIISEYFESLKYEIKLKDLAKKRNMKENTFNQALKRCRERLRNILLDKGFKLKNFL